MPRDEGGDVDGAVAALDLVPTTSRAFTEARRQRAALLASPGAGLPALSAAMTSIEGVGVDPVDRARLTADVLAAALQQVRENGPQPAIRIGGYAAAEPSLRDGLENAYRALAAMSPGRDAKVDLVDRANDVRRWTLR